MDAYARRACIAPADFEGFRAIVSAMDDEWLTYWQRVVKEANDAALAAAKRGER